MFTSPVVAVLLTLCVLAVCAVAYVLQQRFLNMRYPNKSKTNPNVKFLTARDQFLNDLNALRDKLPIGSESMLKTLHWLRDAAEVGLITQNSIPCKINFEDEFNQKLVLTKTVDGYLYVAKFRFGASAKQKEPYAWIVVEGPCVFISSSLPAMQVLGIFATYGKTELFDKQQQLEAKAHETETEET